MLAAGSVAPETRQGGASTVSVLDFFHRGWDFAPAWSGCGESWEDDFGGAGLWQTAGNSAGALQRGGGHPCRTASALALGWQGAGVAASRAAGLRLQAGGRKPVPNLGEIGGLPDSDSGGAGQVSLEQCSRRFVLSLVSRSRPREPLAKLSSASRYASGQDFSRAAKVRSRLRL